MYLKLLQTHKEFSKYLKKVDPHQILGSKNNTKTTVFGGFLKKREGVDWEVMTKREAKERGYTEFYEAPKWVSVYNNLLKEHLSRYSFITQELAQVLIGKTLSSNSKYDELFWVQQGKCFLCGEKLDYLKATKDHVIPKHLGGKGKDNIALTHNKCNRKKGNSSPSKKLLRKLNDNINKIKVTCPYEIKLDLIQLKKETNNGY